MEQTDNRKEQTGSGNKMSARESGPDIVRTLACIFVVGLHFYLNIGYYSEPMNGGRMFVMTFMRWLFMPAVPLFFMLTGYFRRNKKTDRAHYMALVPLVISYVVISVAKMILYNRLYGRIYDLKGMLTNLGNYQIAWFMGMYLCLFLMIPFLNAMWYALDKRTQNILIVTLVFVCSLYPVIRYVAPSYFTGLYPALYYILGIAVADAKPRVNKVVPAAILGVTVLLETVISMKFTSTGLFDWELISTTDGSYATIFVAICTVCIFLMLYDTDVRSQAVRRLLSSVSRVSFEIYLFSGAYDAVIYTYLNRHVSGAAEGFWWFFVTVPASFILAYLSAVIFRSAVNAVLRSMGFSFGS